MSGIFLRPSQIFITFLLRNNLARRNSKVRTRLKARVGE